MAVPGAGHAGQLSRSNPAGALEVPAAPASPGLQPSPADVLYVLDALCADVWCEYAYDFEFRALEFTASSAQLHFALHLHSDAADEERFARSCTLAGYRQPAALLAGGGADLRLNEDAYWTVTSCLDQAMAEVDSLIAEIAPPQLEHAVCRQVLGDTAALAGEELTRACEDADMEVVSLAATRIEFSFLVDLPDGGYQSCLAAIDRRDQGIRLVEPCRRQPATRSARSRRGS